MPEIVALQFIAKIMGGGVWSYLLKKRDRHKTDPK